MDEDYGTTDLHAERGSLESLENPYDMVKSSKAKFASGHRGSAASQSINAISNTSLPQLRSLNASPVQEIVQDSILKRRSYNDSLKISIAEN